jgi:hypothetical protein
MFNPFICEDQEFMLMDDSSEVHLWSDDRSHGSDERWKVIALQAHLPKQEFRDCSGIVPLRKDYATSAQTKRAAE